jgi:protein required for attachment to host cells
MSKTWIVVADTSRARVFFADTPAAALTEKTTLTHPASRLHEGDLISDRAGRDRDPGGSRHSKEGKVDAKHEEANRFADEICNLLESARSTGELEKLYIIAAPEFLGLLRKHLPGPLQKLVTGAIPKNLSTHDPAEIRKSLPRFL